MMLGNISSNLTILCQAYKHVHIFSLFKCYRATCGAQNVDILDTGTFGLNLILYIDVGLLIIVNSFGLGNGLGEEGGSINRLFSN